MRALIAAVPNAVDPVFIASPSTALTIGLLSPASSLPLIVAPTVPDETLILIDANDFASAEGDLPVFDASSESTLHEEDTAPLPINAGTVASPVRSLWQTDTIGLRLLADVSWAMIRSGRVAYIVAIGW